MEAWLETRVSQDHEMVAGTQGYGENADSLSERYDKVDVQALYAQAWAHFPAAPASVLDIGAGSGRDAAYFAELGHPVTAVEPCGPLREAAKSNHPHPGIAWFDSSLPALDGVTARYELVLVAAVWMHLDPSERQAAMPAVAARLAPGGLLHISLRHGPIPPGRRMFAVTSEETLALAGSCGLAPVANWTKAAQQRGNQKAGVHFSTLLFRHTPE